MKRIEEGIIIKENDIGILKGAKSDELKSGEGFVMQIFVAIVEVSDDVLLEVLDRI